MVELYGVYIFILSLLVGSFLNVAIYRTQEKMSLAHPSSHCPNCNYSLRWFDLIPVISFILLRGKCRKCKTKISIRYPMVELSTAVLAWLIYFTNNMTVTTAAYIILLYFLVVVAMIDFDCKSVYTDITRIGALIGMMYLFYTVALSRNIVDGIESVAGAVVMPLVLLVLSKLSKENAIGEGDAEIMLMVSLFLGFKLSLLTLFIAFVSGGAVALVMILKFSKSGKYELPFGPFIAFGALISMIYGLEIMHFYMSLLI